jgi:hypothetical protein
MEEGWLELCWMIAGEGFTGVGDGLEGGCGLVCGISMGETKEITGMFAGATSFPDVSTGDCGFCASGEGWAGAVFCGGAAEALKSPNPSVEPGAGGGAGSVVRGMLGGVLWEFSTAGAPAITPLGI